MPERKQRERPPRDDQSQGGANPHNKPTGEGVADQPAGAQTFADRASALAASNRVAIDTEDLAGSINLTGARIDDLRLEKYRETVDPASPIITLLSPSGAPGGYYVEHGWAPAAGATVTLPDANTVWTLEGDATTLTAATPVTLRYDNGQGLIFRRTISRISRRSASASADPCHAGRGLRRWPSASNSGSRSSIDPATAGPRRRERTRISAAFTAIRCSQVPSRAWPSKPPIDLNADRNAS